MGQRAFDPTTPNIARMYDYWLGGKDHLPADRRLAEQIATMHPQTPAVIRANRAFLGRVVTYLARECGIRQFVDIGTGLPTADNTHQVARRIDPECRIVYVDNDLLVIRHAEARLAGDNKHVGVVQADLREPESILGAAETRRLIDFAEPVALLMIAVLHFIPDTDDPHGLIGALMDGMPAGSILAISHGEAQPRLHEGADLYSKEVRTATRMRTRDEIATMFADLQLAEPGLVPITQWRPSEPPGELNPWMIGGVGRKLVD